MKMYLILVDDSSNCTTMQAAFSTREKAQEFFAKEMEDYWPKAEWNNGSYDIDGKTAEECIEKLEFYDAGLNHLYGMELEVDSGKLMQGGTSDD